MAKKEINKINNSLSLQNNQELVARILGATLNCDIKSLYKLFKNHENNDEVSFTILTGIFHLLSGDHGLHEVLRPLDTFENGHPSPQKLLKEFFEKFEEILSKQNYSNYPVAVVPGANINREDFLGESFIGIFGKLFYIVFFGNFSRHRGDDAFIVSDNIKALLRIISNLGLADNNFNKLLLSTAYDSLDSVFRSNFSNSKSKVWDSRRAALDYFIMQLYIFNDAIPKKSQEFLFKRWKAWFLLEDRYKIENKKVDRKKLQDEMMEIFKKI